MITATLTPPLGQREGRIDRDLFGDLTVPARQSRHPRNSRAFVRIDTSLRAYWHTLFDICPQLLDLTGPDGLAIYRPFMVWAAERKLTFTWTYYLWVWCWLRQSEFRDRLSEELLISMMAASAGRWAGLDRGPECGIVVACPELSPVVAAWKCRSPGGARQAELLELEEPLPEAPEPFGWFTVPEFALGAFPGWRPIPR